MNQKKFATFSEIELFKALQKYGKLSQKKLAKKAGLPKTTIQYALERLQERDFLETKVNPKLQKFPELPLALISFSDLHPIKLRQLKKSYINKEEVRAFISNNKELLIILMHTSKDRLVELIIEIMEKARAKLNLHILSPSIEKFDLTIPDKILEAMYPDIAQKRK